MRINKNLLLTNPKIAEDGIHLFRAESFVFRGKTYFCHRKACKFPETGSCYHCAMFAFDDESERIIAQIQDIRVNREHPEESFVYVRLLLGMKAFRQEILSSVECSDLFDALQLLEDVEEHHYSFESLSHEVSILPLYILSDPCFFFNTNERKMCAVLLTDYERD